ncbi:potassium efflux protein KefA [Actinobacillus equuli]|nr:potassium efflux protein KefA [Actinobacillus equuli]
MALFCVYGGNVAPEWDWLSSFQYAAKSNAVFRDILKRSVWVIGLMLNTAVFSNINEMGIAYDVLGQVFTIIVLISIILLLHPDLDKRFQFIKMLPLMEKTLVTCY